MPVGESGLNKSGAVDLFLDVHQPKRRIKLKKIFIGLFLMFFAMPVFANPATDSTAASKAYVKCAQTGGNCNAEQARYNAATSAFHKDLVQGQEAQEQHDRDVMRDERLRQQVRQRGY